jgi:hypothetical protein
LYRCWSMPRHSLITTSARTAKLLKCMMIFDMAINWSELIPNLANS